MGYNFKKIVETVAKQHGTTPDVVLQGMQNAINEAYARHDPSTQEFWDRVTVNGKMPTVEEFILEAVQAFKKERRLIQ